MEQVTITSIQYIESETIRKQGTYKDIERYLKQGYIEQDNRNGNIVLVKPAQVSVTLESQNCTKTFNMKNDIKDYYNKDRISKGLVKEFQDDVKSGKITVQMEEDGSSYRIVR